MLAKSPEKTLATLAEMELAEPDKTTQMNELADSWYDKGKKSFGNERAQFLERAEYWYQLVLPDTKNITHTIVSKRLEEIDKLLPVREITNYDRISNAQWNRITSPIYEVKAAAFRTDTDIKLDATQTIRVVPQPTDTWRLNNAAKNIKLETTAKGDETMQFSGALLVGVGRNGQASRDMIAHGPGAVWFCSKMNRARGYHADGSIRVKVVPVTDE
jgi:hypothetical protein